MQIVASESPTHCCSRHYFYVMLLSVVSWPREAKESMTWWGSVIRGAVRQWRTVLRSPLYISFWSETRTKRGNGCLIADWIGFWRNTITSGSNLPGAGLCTTCGFSQNDGCTHNGGCRQTSQPELPTWKHEGPNQQLVLHHMSVMGCLNSNSVELLATKAYWKVFYCDPSKTYFLLSPAVMFFSLFSLMFFTCADGKISYNP